MTGSVRHNLEGSGGMLPLENLGLLHLPRSILVKCSYSILVHKYY